jgi:hypothetical protein
MFWLFFSNYPSTSSFGSCSLFSLVHANVCIICLGLIGYLHVNCSYKMGLKRQLLLPWVLSLFGNGLVQFYSFVYRIFDRLCGLVVRVLGYRSGGPGSISGITKKKVVGLERGPLSLVSTTKELLDRKVAAPL